MSSKRESNNHRYNLSHNYREKQEMEELADVRIITKNLVYIIGLSSNIAHREKLSKYEYLGQYGTIIKIVVNRNKAYNQNSPHGPSYSAYVTYSKPYEASIAILSLDDKMIDNHLIRASFGTTKYCSFFLKGVECTNKECLFLHKIADESDIIKRGDLTINKNIFNQQHKYAIKIVDIYNPEVKKKILSLKKGKTIFPSPDVIYKTLTGIEKEANNSKNKKSNVKDKEKISPVKENKIKETEDKNNNKFDFINDSNEYKKKKRLSEEENYEEEEEDDAEDEENYENDDDNNINNSIDIKNKKNFENKKNKELLNRNKSRFDFCEKNTNENISNNIIMPEHIINLINKKINSFILTKYMQQKLIDKMFLNESIKNDNISQNDEWTKFIKDNTEISNYNNLNNSEDMMNELDKINNLIMRNVSPKNN